MANFSLYHAAAKHRIQPSKLCGLLACLTATWYLLNLFVGVNGIVSMRTDSGGRAHGGGTNFDTSSSSHSGMNPNDEFGSYHKCIARNGSVMSAEQRIICELIRTTGYEPAVRPVKDSKQAVEVRLSITLVMIFDMDERNQILTTIFWLDQEWTDEFLGWDPEKYGGIKRIRVPCQMLWLPDVVLYNNADDFTGGYMQTRAMVNHDGGVFWPPPTKMRSSCKVDITYFPFDVQECRMKFGTWTYDGFQVDVTNRTMEVDLGNYVRNGEWELLDIRIERNVVRYGCCAEPYPDVSFYITIRRRSLYYMFNIVLPVMMMSAVTLLVFLLPPESGEKIALGITVLLAFSVFMLAIAEKMPETSEFIPLIGIYLTLVIAMTSLSIIVTVIVINFYHYGASRQPVPRWACWLVLFQIARLVRIETTYTIQHEIMTKQQRRTAAANKKQKSILCCCTCGFVDNPQTLDENESDVIFADAVPHMRVTQNQTTSRPSPRRVRRHSKHYCTPNHVAHKTVTSDDEHENAIAIAMSANLSNNIHNNSSRKQQHITTSTLLQRSHSSPRWGGEVSGLDMLASSPIDAISSVANHHHGFHQNQWQSMDDTTVNFPSNTHLHANNTANIKTNYYVNQACLVAPATQQCFLADGNLRNHVSAIDDTQTFETSFASPPQFDNDGEVHEDFGTRNSNGVTASPGGASSALSAALPPTSSQVQRDTVAVLNVMLERQRYEAVTEQISREWRQIAQVIDRLLFIVFLIGIVASTLTILVVMPAFYDKADLPSLEQRLTEKRLAEGKEGGFGGD